MSLFDVTGKVAVVTGGTRGIGRAIAEGLVAAGARVTVVSRNEEACQETAEHLRGQGGEAIGFAADMGKLEDVPAIVDRTVAEFGGLDVLVNNAGVGPFHTMGEFTVDDWQEVFDINVRGPVFLMQEALPHLKRSGRGAVLNILSIAAFVNAGPFAIYGSSKAALFAHTRSASAELAKYGIRVNAIAPGPVWTPLNPADSPADKVAKFGAATDMKRPAQPEELSPAYVFLAAPVCSSYISGIVLPVTGKIGS